MGKVIREAGRKIFKNQTLKGQCHGSGMITAKNKGENI